MSKFPAKLRDKLRLNLINAGVGHLAAYEATSQGWEHFGDWLDTIEARLLETAQLVLDNASEEEENEFEGDTAAECMIRWDADGNRITGDDRAPEIDIDEPEDSLPPDPFGDVF